MLEERRQKSIAKLRMFFADPRYQEAMSALKQRIAMGRTIEECRSQMNQYPKDFWENLLDMLAYATFSPHTTYFHHHMRLQKRYEDAENLRLRAQLKNDRRTEAAMIMLMAKLDESSIEIAERLGLIKPGDLINPDSFDQYETMTHEELEVEYKRLCEASKTQSQADPEIIDIKSLDVQPDTQDGRAPGQLGVPPMVQDDSTRQKP